MKNKISKKIVCLAAAAMLFVAGNSIKSAMAYFTTYVAAQGSETLELGFTETIIHENVSNGIKTVWIENTGESPCFVRVKVIVATKYGTIHHVEPLNDWIKNGDYYEYHNGKNAIVLEPGKTTTKIEFDINSILSIKPDENTADVNVIVIQECAPVLYDDDGNTYAGWDDGNLKNDFIIEKKSENMEPQE